MSTFPKGGHRVAYSITSSARASSVAGSRGMTQLRLPFGLLMACLYCQLCRTRPRKTSSKSPSWPQPSCSSRLRSSSRPPKSLNDFDQLSYLTIAYDIDRYGVFSNGIFDQTDSTRTAPAAGMFFVPGYPMLVLAAMKLDSRFAKAVACSVEANHDNNESAECEAYATPIHILHAFLLALGVLAIALSGALIFGSARVFWLAGVLATGSFSAEADLCSFIMTESMTVSLYSIFTLFAVLAWKTSRIRYFALAGIFLGLLCLTRPSFVVVIPVMLVTHRVERPVARSQKIYVLVDSPPRIRNRMLYRSSGRGSFATMSPWGSGD